MSVENCVSFLDPLIESWDIDLQTFGMEIVLNRRLAVGRPKRFEFVEREPEQHFGIEPGLEEFLRDTSLGGDATEEEIESLRKLRSGENGLLRSTIIGNFRILETSYISGSIESTATS